MATTYSTDFTDTAREKINALLTTLLSTMASGYDPTFSYLYNTHGPGALSLNAISIELDSMEVEEVGSSAGAGPIARYLLKYSLRFHVGYEGEYFDNLKLARIMNSVNNNLRENYSLGDSYWIVGVEDYTFNDHFVESHTIGGKMVVSVLYAMDHP